MTAFPRQMPRGLAEAAVAEFDDGADLAASALRRGLAHVVRATCGQATIIADPAGAFAVLQILIDAIIDQYLSEFSAIGAALDAKGIPVLVPKGVFFAASVYPDLAVPFSGDVDLLIPEGDLAGATAVLANHGFRDDLVVLNNTPVALPPPVMAARSSTLGHFGQSIEFSKLVRAEHLDPYLGFARRFLPRHIVIVDDQAYMRPAFDLHTSLNSLHDRAGSRFRPQEPDWWSRTQRVSLRGVEFSAPADTTVAWYAANHFYTDVMLFGDRNLKLLGDLIALTKAGRVDFDALASIATRHVALAPPLFYMFRMMHSSFGLDVPSDFLAAVNIPTDASGTDFADFGDPLAKVVGVRLEVAVDGD